MFGGMHTSHILHMFAGKWLSQVVSKLGTACNAVDFGQQARHGNLVGVSERLLAGWDVDSKDKVSGWKRIRN